jgi:DNA-binding SARP family transcriptional activator
MKFYVLGAVGIGDGTHRITAPRGLTGTALAILLLNHNQPVQPEVLAASLWPNSLPASAGANVRQYMSNLRKLLRGCSPGDESRLQLTNGGYLLEARRYELDLTCFADLADAGQRAYDSRDFRTARWRLENAAHLWQGDICQGAVLGPALEVTVRYWEERRFAVSRLLLQTRLQLGEYGQAIAEIHPLVAHDPFCEDLWATLMLALYHSQRRGDALKAFRTARRHFVSELGIEPSKRLQYLHQSILKDDDLPGNSFGLLPLDTGPRPAAASAAASRAG